MRESAETNVALKEEIAHRGMRIALDILERAKERGVEYRIVGGTALISFLTGEYRPLRENGTVRDIDVIVMADPEGVVKDVKEQLERIRHTDLHVPPIVFSTVHEHDDRRPFQLLRALKRTTDGGYALSFRDINFRIPDEILRRENGRMRLNGEERQFDTFPPATLLHLYMTRAPFLKHKDVTKVKAFAKEMSRSGSFSFKDNHAPYEVFHDFAEAVRAKYPIYSTMIRTYNALDNALFGGIISHTLIPEKIWKLIID